MGLLDLIVKMQNLALRMSLIKHQQCRSVFPLIELFKILQLDRVELEFARRDLHNDPAVIREPFEIIVHEFQRFHPHILVLRGSDVDVFKLFIGWRCEIRERICPADF